MEALDPKTIMDRLNDELEALRKKGFTVVGNVQHLSQVPPLHVPTLEIVEVNPNPAYGDVYEQKGGKLSMTAQCIRKFSNALNVIWRGGEVLAGSTQSCIRFRAKASRKGIDGSWQHVEKDKEIDLDAIYDGILLKNTDRSNYFRSGRCPADKLPKSWRATTPEEAEGWIAHETKEEMIEKRKHKLTNAQTGAQTRCVRELGQLKGTYTVEELANPFIVLKIIFQPDPNHPLDRQFMLQNSMGAIDSLYPPSSVADMDPKLALQATAQALPALVDPKGPPALTSLEFTGNDAGDVQPFVEPEPTAEAKPIECSAIDPKPGSAEGVTLNAVLDFEASDAEEQCRALQHLINTRSFHGKTEKPLKDFSLEERIAFFDHLSKLAPTTKQVSLPWS